jgi:hypothetical protein
VKLDDEITGKVAPVAYDALDVSEPAALIGCLPQDRARRDHDITL